MAAREQPYDPYIPSGHAAQNGGQQHGGDSRTAALQAVGLSHALPHTFPSLRASSSCSESCGGSNFHAATKTLQALHISTLLFSSWCHRLPGLNLTIWSLCVYTEWTLKRRSKHFGLVLNQHIQYFAIRTFWMRHTASASMSHSCEMSSSNLLTPVILTENYRDCRYHETESHWHWSTRSRNS